MTERDSCLYVGVTDELWRCLSEASSDDSDSSSCLSQSERDALAAVREEDRISLQHLQLLRRWLQARGEADGAVCSMLKGSKVLAAKKPPQIVNAELEARRQYLRAKQEQREYNAMVADIAPNGQPKDSFASYKHQLNVGVNIIVSMAVMYIVCYFAGAGIFREQWQQMLCGLAGMIIIIFVETALFVVREYETKSSKKPAENMGLNAKE